MKLDFDDYRIATDDKQFIVKKKNIVKAGPLTKEENVGNITWKDIAYCSNLNSALKNICRNVLLENNDLVVIKTKLDEIESKIEEFTKILKDN